MTRDKFGQLFLSVLVIVGLVIVAIFGISLVGQLVFWGGGIGLNNDDFWIATSVMSTFYVANFALVFLAAAARLTFASENRSTALRVAMVVEYLCLAGWMSAEWRSGGERDILCMFLALAAGFWYVMGVLMTGELPIFSRRVMRSLPQSFLGRILFTWFNPGPGTGYGFAVVNFLSAVVLVALALLLEEIVPSSGGRPGNPPPGSVLVGGFALVCYLTIFLGLGKLIVAWIGRFVGRNTAMPILIHFMLLLFAVLIPFAIDWTMFGTSDYSLLHITNPFWTATEFLDGSGWPLEGPLILVLLSAVALAILLANWRSLKRELSYLRAKSPQRLIEDDAEMAPTVEPVRSSPWDEA